MLTLGNLTECVVCEITFNNKKCFVISIYRSPSQNVEEFAIFIHELEHIINTISIPGNPNPIIIIGDFNAKLSTWNPSDPDSQEGIELASMTSLYGLTQMITDPTHILPNSSSCIDLLFTNQPNIILKKEYIHHYIQTVTIKSFMQKSILKYVFLLHTNAIYGIIIGLIFWQLGKV